MSPELERSLRRLEAAAAAAASDALRAGVELHVVEEAVDRGLRDAWQSHQRLAAAYESVAGILAQHGHAA